MEEKSFVVRVSRWFLLMMISIGIIFTALGLDILVFHFILEPTGAGTNPLLMNLFGGFALLIGVVLVVSQFIYLIVPPVMLKVTREGFWFGTGMRYKPYFIPRNHFQSVGIYLTESMLEIGGKKRIVNGGIELQFKPGGELPRALVTSAGLSYSDYTLRLFKTYMNKPLEKAVESIRLIR